MSDKVIHFLWLDFNNKRDGVLDPKLEFFNNRIIRLHPGWKINFINKWNECMKQIDKPEFKWIKKHVLLNPNIGAAHKSDVIRFYYLYTQGGVWIDISTYLVEPLDKLAKENKNGFSCYYMPGITAQYMTFKPTSDLYDLLNVDTYMSKVSEVYGSSFKSEQYNFIPENYFLISRRKHPICRYVLTEFRKMYTKKSTNIRSMHNLYIHRLMKSIFKTNEGLLKEIKDQEKFWKNKGKFSQFLDSIYNGGYLFNYFMLYIAIVKYSRKNGGKVSNKRLSKTRSSVIKSSKYNTLCNEKACNDIIIRCKKDNIHLLSASYNRLSKWSDNLEQRIEWDDTLAGEIIKSKKDINNHLESINVKQLKFSSWTRNSKIINILMKKVHKGNKGSKK